MTSSSNIKVFLLIWDTVFHFLGLNFNRFEPRPPQSSCLNSNRGHHIVATSIWTEALRLHPRIKSRMSNKDLLNLRQPQTEPITALIPNNVLTNVPHKKFSVLYIWSIKLKDLHVLSILFFSGPHEEAEVHRRGLPRPVRRLPGRLGLRRLHRLHAGRHQQGEEKKTNIAF